MVKDIKTEIISDESTIIIICCSSKKEKNSELIYKEQKISFVANPLRGKNDNILYFHPDDLVLYESVTWRSKVIELQKNNDYTLFKSYELYLPKEPNKDVYRNLHTKFKNKLYILSAGWGLISSDFKIPKYDITFSSKACVTNKRDSSNDKSFKDFNHLEERKINKDDKIIFLGGRSYINQFCELTKCFSNQKIIYYFGDFPKVSKEIINNHTFVEYNNKSKGITKYNWYYKLAEKMSEVVVPK